MPQELIYSHMAAVFISNQKAREKTREELFSFTPL